MKNYTKLFIRIGLAISVFPFLLGFLCLIFTGGGEGSIGCSILYLMYVPIIIIFTGFIDINLPSGMFGNLFFIFILFLLSLPCYLLPMYLIGKFLDKSKDKSINFN